MREPNRIVQALRDKSAKGSDAARKPSPPPKREVDKGIFTYREVRPAKAKGAA